MKHTLTGLYSVNDKRITDFILQEQKNSKMSSLYTVITWIKYVWIFPRLSVMMYSPNIHNHHGISWNMIPIYPLKETNFSLVECFQFINKTKLEMKLVNKTFLGQRQRVTMNYIQKNCFTELRLIRSQRSSSEQYLRTLIMYCSSFIQHCKLNPHLPCVI